MGKEQNTRRDIQKGAHVVVEPQPDTISGTRQRYQNLIRGTFAVVAGAMVFLPSILGVVKAPFIWEWLLYLFWLFGVSSLVYLAVAYYLINVADSNKLPHRISGVGLLLGLSTLFCIVVYVAANGYED